MFYFFPHYTFFNSEVHLRVEAETDLVHSMTTLEPASGATINRTPGDIRATMVLDIDLNYPPAENNDTEVLSSSILPIGSQQTYVSIDSHRLNPPTHPARVQRGSAPPANTGLNSSVIDVEASDDEVQVFSSSRGFPQARNRSRRNWPVTVILDEDFDTNSINSVGSLTIFSNEHSNQTRVPGNMSVVNCELYPDVEEEYNMKGKSVMESSPEQPKEPTFTCPVCMGELVEPSSTICGHIFCWNCISASIQAQKRCPTCRKKLYNNNFHRVYLPSTA